MSQGRGWVGACLVQFPLDRSFAGKAGTWETLAVTTALLRPAYETRVPGGPAGAYPGDPGLVY